MGDWDPVSPPVPAPAAATTAAVDPWAPVSAPFDPNDPRFSSTSMAGEKFLEGVPFLRHFVPQVGAALNATAQPLTGVGAKGDTWSERYGKDLDQQKAASKTADEEHPVLSGVAKGVGSAASFIPAMMAAPGAFGMDAGATLLANTAAGAGTGMAIGTTDALVGGKGPIDAMKEGGIDALTGGTVPIAGKAIGAAFRGVLNLIKPEAQGVLKGIDPQALDWASKAAKADGLTDQQIAQMIETKGPQAFLGEYGANLKGLTTANATIPGATEGKVATQGAVEARAAGAHDRLEKGIDEMLGPRQNLETLTREGVQERSNTSDPFWKQWRETKITPTADVKKLVTDLESNGLMADAKKVAARKSLASGEEVTPMENFFTTGERKDWPTAESFQHIKTAIDEKIAGSYVNGRATGATGDWKDLKKRLDKTVADSSPEAAAVWNKARDTWATPSAIMDAREAGTKVWDPKYSKDKLLYDLTDMTAPERAAHKEGARAALAEMVDRSAKGDSVARTTLSSPANKNKMQFLAQNKNTDPEKFFKLLDQETEHAGTPKALGKAAETDATQRAKETLSPDPSKTIIGKIMARVPYAPHVQNPLAWMPGYGSVKKGLEARQATKTEAARNALSPLLLKQGSEAQDFARALMQHDATQRGAQSGLTTSGVIRALGRPSTQSQ